MTNSTSESGGVRDVGVGGVGQPASPPVQQPRQQEGTTKLSRFSLTKLFGKEPRRDSVAVTAPHPAAANSVQNEGMIAQTRRMFAMLVSKKRRQSVKSKSLSLDSYQSKDWNAVASAMRNPDPKTEDLYSKHLSHKLDNLIKAKDELEKAKKSGKADLSARESRVFTAVDELRAAINAYEEDHPHTAVERVLREMESLQANLKGQKNGLSAKKAELSALNGTPKTPERERQIKELSDAIASNTRTIENIERRIAERTTELETSTAAYQSHVTSDIENQRNAGIQMLKTCVKNPDYPRKLTVEKLYGDPIGRTFLEASSIQGKNFAIYAVYTLTHFCMKQPAEITAADRDQLDHICDQSWQELQQLHALAERGGDEDKCAELEKHMAHIQTIRAELSRTSDPKEAQHIVQQKLLHSVFLDPSGPLPTNLTGEGDPREKDWNKANTWVSESAPEDVKFLNQKMESELNKQVLDPGKHGQPAPGRDLFPSQSFGTQVILTRLASKTPSKE